ncbi:hypothetical protein [Comamonas aquatica]|jgi:hypothetical protein|nr:hypothetical protein [Comamonas aquatica]
MNAMTARARRRHFLFLWAWPIVLGVLTATGLVAALFSEDGWGDVLAGICLAIPTATGLWFGALRRPAPPRD